MDTEDREIWFPAKRFGWGWGLPCAWQGWVVLAVYVVLIVAGVSQIHARHDPTLLFAWVGGWTAGLLVVCWLKGERPGWRWNGRLRG